MSCKHTQFSAEVDVNRFEDTGGFMADVRVKCVECGTPFQFLGLQPGLDMQGARVSIDGTEAHIAIAPPGYKPNPLQRLTINITGDGMN